MYGSMKNVPKPPKINTKAYSKMIQRHKTTEREKWYNEIRKIEKKIHRKKNKEYFEENMKQIEKLHRQKESRRMYKLVNDIRNEFKPYTTACRDSTGMVLN